MARASGVCCEAVMAVANMVESVLGGGHERPRENPQLPSGTPVRHLPAAVHARAGQGEHQVYAAAVGDGRRGGPGWAGPAPTWPWSTLSLLTWSDFVSRTGRDSFH